MRFGLRSNPSDRVTTGLNSGRKVTAIGTASDSRSSGYRIMTWHADGELVVEGSPLLVEYLVVGGGGAGGTATATSSAVRMAGGGGGAGGYVSNVGGALLTIPVGRHKIVVGAGGTSGGGFSLLGGANDTNGEPSRLGGLIYAHGGGYGGRSGELVYLGTTFDIKIQYGAGGSNGGLCQGFNEDTLVLRPVQGNSGGTSDGTNTRTYNGGGGGGSSAKGGNATGSAGGAGGAGTSNSITGTAVTYAGGGGGGSDTSGGGGAGGSGGGGAGSYNANGSAGTANRGGGGGGAGSSTSNTEYKFGGAGGSGIVIVRYLVNGY
jgi:hypothetical protein